RLPGPHAVFEVRQPGEAGTVAGGGCHLRHTAGAAVEENLGVLVLRQVAVADAPVVGDEGVGVLQFAFVGDVDVDQHRALVLHPVGEGRRVEPGEGLGGG